MGPAEHLMFAGHNHLIYELLAAQPRLLPPATLQAVWTQVSTEGESLADLLVDGNHLDPEGLFGLLADHLDAEFLTKLPTVISREQLGEISSDLAQTYQVVPIGHAGNSVRVVAVDPLRWQLREELGFSLGRMVEIVVADPRAVSLLLQRYYPVRAPGETLTTAKEFSPSEQAELSSDELQDMAGQAPVVRFVNRILIQAIRDKASDIHFEPFAREFKIRYRIDGALFEIMPPPPALALPVISRLKVLANLNIAERRLPQDGRIKFNLEGRSIDLRISTLPTQGGESVVLRVLDQSSVLLELDQLGLPDEIRLALQATIRRPNGILVVTGPTGSGKTTTLYSCLKQLNEPGVKLLTIEDPVEYEIDGIMQVPVNLAAGLTFARALRTFLRQDPDIVMVGEIRDTETAQIAIQASLTGHLVLTTLHTNDAASAVTRLIDMGIEPYLLASTLEAVVAQRLVRRLCPHCREPYEPDSETVKSLEFTVAWPEGRSFYRARGCPECHHAGYQGRLAIFEYMQISELHREMIVAGASVQIFQQQQRASGNASLRSAALVALLAGETTVDEVFQHT